MRKGEGVLIISRAGWGGRVLIIHSEDYCAAAQEVLSGSRDGLPRAFGSTALEANAVQYVLPRTAVEEAAGCNKPGREAAAGESSASP